MDYTYRERHGEGIYRLKGGMLPSDFFHRNPGSGSGAGFVLSFQEDAIGIRLRDVIGVDKMMWGSDYPHSESTFPQSRKILAEILAGVPDDEQAKIAAGNTARVYNFDVARLNVPALRPPCAKSDIGVEGAGAGSRTSSRRSDTGRLCSITMRY